MDEPYIYHFPDGNASIARLIVRSLIPAVAPGDTMEDIVTARFDYGALDVAGPADPSAAAATGGARAATHDGRGRRRLRARRRRLHRVRGDGAVLAGYHMMIPCDHARAAAAQQRQALRANVKAPLVVHEGRRARLATVGAIVGVHEITNPMGFFSRLKLDYPVSIGDYRCPRSPDEPMVLHLVHVPTVPDRGLRRATARRRRGSCSTTPRSTTSSSTSATS